MSLIYITLLVVFLCSTGDLIESKVDYYSYRVESNTVDDGHKAITEIKSSDVKSTGSKEPKVEKQEAKLIGPSKFKQEYLPSARMMMRPMTVVSWKDERYQEEGHLHVDGTVVPASKGRSVESPALSVDSGAGGLSSGSAIADGISRLLNVNGGHYSNLYNQIGGVGAF